MALGRFPIDRQTSCSLGGRSRQRDTPCSSPVGQRSREPTERIRGAVAARARWNHRRDRRRGILPSPSGRDRHRPHLEQSPTFVRWRKSRPRKTAFRQPGPPSSTGIHRSAYSRAGRNWQSRSLGSRSLREHRIDTNLARCRGRFRWNGRVRRRSPHRWQSKTGGGVRLRESRRVASTRRWRCCRTSNPCSCQSTHRPTRRGSRPSVPQNSWPGASGPPRESPPAASSRG
mmetsp:Transcript_21912/g.46228  ORF Transcript_21912/g.46228 Transcript_21912/m.46228 type:complete len:230 (-) Transcript_21912:517-1206(-)